MRTRHNKKRFVPTKPTANSIETNNLALRYLSLPPNTAESNSCLSALIMQLRKLIDHELGRTPSEEAGGLAPYEKEELKDYLLTLHLSYILRKYNPAGTTFTHYFRVALRKRLNELLYFTPSAFNVTGGARYFRRKNNIGNWKKYKNPKIAKHIRRIKYQESLSPNNDLSDNGPTYQEHPSLSIPENTRLKTEENLQRDFFLKNLPKEAVPVVKAILDGECRTKSEYKRLLHRHKINKVVQKKIRIIVKKRTKIINE